MYARLRCGGNLPQCLAFGTGVLGVLWWLGGWVVGIRYRKQAFTVPNMRAVRKTGSCGTRCIFKGPHNSRLHRLWTAYCRTGRIFSARNGHRSLCSLRRPLPLLLRRHSVPETATARR